MLEYALLMEELAFTLSSIFIGLLLSALMQHNQPQSVTAVQSNSTWESVDSSFSQSTATSNADSTDKVATLNIPQSWQHCVAHVYVSPSMSVRDYIVLLANESGANVKFSADLKDVVGVSYSAHGATFLEVLKNLSSAANWALHVSDNGDISISNDTMYYHTHSVGFLVLPTSQSQHVSGHPGSKGSMPELVTSVSSTSQSEILCHNNPYQVPMDTVWGEIVENLNFYTQQVSGTSYTINKVSGQISVYAPQRIQSTIAKFILDLKERLLSQVRIEAKVIQVYLNQSMELGVNWGSIDWKAIGSNDLTKLVNWLGNFGQVHTIANPCVRVLNQQCACLSITYEEAYFSIHPHIAYIPGADKAYPVSNASFDTKIHKVPLGLSLYVQPVIDFDGNGIVLRIQPYNTSLKSKVDNLSIKVFAAQNKQSASVMKDCIKESKIPCLESVTTKSAMYIKSGETAVLGGMLSSHADTQSNASQQSFSIGRGQNVSETVVLVKAYVEKLQLSPQTLQDYLLLFCYVS